MTDTAAERAEPEEAGSDRQCVGETVTDDARSDSETSSARVRSILAEDLSLTYSDGTEAVSNVSLSIPRGEFFGFLGPNGAGKTTTIKLLATLLEPTSGEVRINGFDAGKRPTAVRGTIGYMAQETTIDEELTARENLEFACEAYGVDGSDRIADLLALVDLADVPDTPAGHFSGGMKKRLDATTALVHDPDLVFLDEPTTGLDPKARNRLWEYFERINDEGTTIFLTTQCLEEADQLCDRIAVIRDGEFVADGPPEELKRRVGGEIVEIEVDGGPETIETAVELTRERDQFGPNGTVDATDGTIRITTERARELGPEVIVAYRDRGIDVTSFDVEEPTLDDVFLAIANEDTVPSSDEEADTTDATSCGSGGSQA